MPDHSIFLGKSAPCAEGERDYCIAQLPLEIGQMSDAEIGAAVRQALVDIEEMWLRRRVWEDV